MAKFKNLLCLLCTAVLAIPAFSYEIPDMEAGMNESLVASENANKSSQETPIAETQAADTGSVSLENNAGLQLDRSGIGRASVHLQILQQSNQHFNSDAGSVKKPAEEKRSNPKPASSN